MTERPSAGPPAGSDRPLAGLLVVDLSRYLPGPLVSRLLADLGARVLKIEEPTLGDPARHDPQGRDGKSALAAMLLAGHESLALDLKKDAARACLEELLLEADVLVESFRPGTLARLGLDPAELRQRFPRLVIASVTGWGQDGPHAHRAGHDLTYQALAGSLASSGHMPTVQVADIVGAWSAVSAVLAALYRRDHRHKTRGREDGETNGEGAHVDQALLDAAGHAAITAWAAESDGPKTVGEPLMLTGAIPCYDLYKTKDGGRLALAALEPKFWKSFCRATDRKDLVLRQYSREPTVRDEVTKLVASRTREEWERLMHEHDIPAEPVLSASEALEHPQVRHRGLVQEGPEGLPRLGFPAKIDGIRPRGDARFPELGGETEKLLDEFALARGVAGSRRAAGIGRKRSVKRWLLGVATRVVARKGRG